MEVNMTITLILDYYLLIKNKYFMYKAVRCWNTQGQKQCLRNGLFTPFTNTQAFEQPFSTFVNTENSDKK